MKSNKEKLFYYMQEASSKENQNFKGFTTQELAITLNMQRSNLSALLNEFVKEGKVIKINGRPVYYKLKKHIHSKEEGTCFDQLIGCNTTLKNQIQLAKAAILYPNEPLATLISGGPGVGKSYFAYLMYEYAKSQNVITPNAPYIKFNCSYYNNQDNELIQHLFGQDENDYQCAVSKAKNGVLFIDHIECMSAKAKNLLVNLIETKKQIHNIIVICAINQDEQQIIDKVITTKFPMTIKLPSLSQRNLDERLQLVQKFFADEAIKMRKDIKINSELLRCFLLYYCEGNLKQLKSDIQIGCANAYVRFFKDNSDILYVYVYDCPNYIRKGFLFYKDYRNEIESLIPQDYAYIFTSDNIKKTEGIRIDKSSATLYDFIDRKVNELRKRGVEDEDITTVISADIESEVIKYKNKIDSTINKESLSKIVDKYIIDIIDALLITASNMFKRVYPSSTFSSLCLYAASIVNNEPRNKPLSNEKIIEIIEKYKDEYTLCVKFISKLEEIYNVNCSIDDVVFMTMILTNTTEVRNNKNPVLLVAMHGSVASSIVQVLNSLTKTNIAYSYDLLLEKDMNEAYEELKQYCKQIDQGAGIMLLYDMGSIKKMAETIVVETGIQMRMIELPATLIALSSVIKLNDSKNLEETYQSIIKNQFGMIGNLQDNFNRHEKERNKIIITLCMTGKGTAIQMKQYLENSLMLDNKTQVVALAISDRSVLMDSINKIKETASVQCIVGTYDPKLYGIPFISIAALFDTPVEKIPMLLSLDKQIISSDVDYDKMYEYLSEQLNNIDIGKLRRFLRPAVIKIKRLVQNDSLDLEVGLFMHIACAIGRIVNNEPMPISTKKNQILNKNKTLYNDLKEILKPLEKSMNIQFSDDEIAIIIEIIK